jgi:hypothetical protein
MKSLFENEKFRKLARQLLRWLPIAAILVGAALPIPLNARRWLIAAALVWLQFYMLGEIFGK